MQKRVRTTLYLMAMVLFALATVVYLILELQAHPNHPQPLSGQEIRQAKRIISATIPGNYTSSSEKTLTLSETELELVLNFLLQQYLDGIIQVQITDQRIRFHSSLPLFPNRFGPFLNIDFMARQKDDGFHIRTLKIGKLEFANRLSGWLTKLIVRHTPFAEYDRLLRQHVRQVNLSGNRLTIRYFWNPEAFAQAASLIRSRADKELVQLYQKRLFTLLKRHPGEKRMPLVKVLQPLFRYARDRARNRDDPVEENRAILVAVSRYLHRLRLGKNPVTNTPKLTLNKRSDLAYHFMTSAALSATASDKLADFVGIYKEIRDSDGGSGFSFADLSANRAGTRFGELAVRDADTAKDLQKAMSRARSDALYMPETKNLPDGLNAAEFEHRYGSMKSPAFLAVKTEIEAAISERAIYQ